MGCRYCQWNCPWDAPKYNESAGTIGKCSLCVHLLEKEMEPSCVSACPTGALSFGNIPAGESHKLPSWLPDNKLNPSLSIVHNSDFKPLITEPADRFSPVDETFEIKANHALTEWSLILFTFLSILTVSYVTGSLARGIFPDVIAFSVSQSLSIAASMLHLGRASKAWRAVLNIRHSPLSREIGLFILFTLFVIISILKLSPLILLISSVAGFLLLIQIDLVYYYSDSRQQKFTESGQAFITGLLITSFFSHQVLPFAFIALIKLIFSVRSLIRGRRSGFDFNLRFVRIAMLLFTVYVLIINSANYDKFILVLFLAGELFDRILFYSGFSPVNIRDKIKINNGKRDF
jgi:DMSO reductase anchor subunit